MPASPTNPALRHLQAKVETAARGAGFDLPARRFVPHVTLARLPERLAGPGGWRGGGGARRLRGAGVPVEDFRLFRSHLAGCGASYEELARYPLTAPAGQNELDEARK